MLLAVRKLTSDLGQPRLELHWALLHTHACIRVCDDGINVRFYSGVDLGFWSGGPSRVLTPGYIASPKCAENRGFPWKLPENCMILTKSWGQGGPAPRAPWIHQCRPNWRFYIKLLTVLQLMCRSIQVCKKTNGEFDGIPMALFVKISHLLHFISLWSLVYAWESRSSADATNSKFLTFLHLWSFVSGIEIGPRVHRTQAGLEFIKHPIRKLKGGHCQKSNHVIGQRLKRDRAILQWCPRNSSWLVFFLEIPHNSNTRTVLTSI